MNVYSFNRNLSKSLLARNECRRKMSPLSQKLLQITTKRIHRCKKFCARRLKATNLTRPAAPFGSETFLAGAIIGEMFEFSVSEAQSEFLSFCKRAITSFWR